MAKLSKNAQVPQCDKTAVTRGAFYNIGLSDLYKTHK